MPVLVNYARALRNPSRLLDACGAAVPTRAGEEKAFLQRLFVLPSLQLRPLLVFAGGFTDNLSGLMYRIVDHFPVDMAAQCDIFYREHDEGKAMRDLACFYAARGLPVLFIGHSWGASSLVWNVVDRIPFPVEFLATLDPVDWRSRPPHMPQVRRWINVYVDYSHAPWTVDNMVARIGRAWEYLDAATENYAYESARHSWAEPMYVHHVWQTLRSTLKALAAQQDGGDGDTKKAAAYAAAEKWSG